jgi:hypothetical protein
MNVPQPLSSSGPSIDVVVDGHRAELVEVSSTRALVHSVRTLKPEQRVRVVLRSNGGAVLRAQARVTSAKFEIPKEGPRYRVELAFEGDTEALEKFLQ